MLNDPVHLDLLRAAALDPIRPLTVPEVLACRELAELGLLERVDGRPWLWEVTELGLETYEARTTP